MQKFNLHNLKSVVITLVVATFFCCENNFEDVKKVGVLQNQPMTQADNVDLKYTEYNGTKVRLVANLISPSLLDYSNRSFSFSEFPKGIKLIVYSEEGEKTTIFADYAISFDKTDIIDLQGNVRIATQKKDTLFTEQLYYNKKLEWVFTNAPIIFKRGSGLLHGNGFDSDKNFENYQILEMVDSDFTFKN